MATAKTTEMPIRWIDKKSTLAFSVSEYKKLFLWGIPLCNNLTGETVSDELIEQNIIASQNYVEEYLGLKFFKQIIEESKDFVREEYQNWGFIKTSYMVNKPISLTGNLNNQEQISYPTEWLSTRKTSDKQSYFAELYVVPNGQNNTTTQFLAVNYSQYFSFYGARVIPNYWKMKYVTGFDKVPTELLNLVGKLAAVKILPIIEMSIGTNGASFGLASQSLSLDGLSQSVSKSNNGNLFQTRIKQYTDEIEKELAIAKSIYVGIRFDVL